MRNHFWTKTLAVAATSGVVLVGGAGMASADTWDGSHSHSDTTMTEVSDNQLLDGGNVSLDELFQDSVDVGDVASGNNVLNGVDADVTGLLSGILNGNTADTQVDPQVDTDIDTDSTVDGTSGADHDAEGLLGLF
jgi:hypothetical protein